MSTAMVCSDIVARSVARVSRGSSPRVSKGVLAGDARPDGRATAPIASRRADTVRQENSLARNLWNVIEDLIHRLKAKVRHADCVNVRITKRDAQLRAALQHPAVFRGELAFEIGR